MKTNYVISLLVSACVLLSCGKKQEVNNKNVLEYKGLVARSYNCPPPPPPPAAQDLRQEKNNAKLVKKGSLTLSTTDIELTKKQIYEYVKNCNGYVVNENLEAKEPYSSYSILLNIEASQFDRFVYLLDSAKLNVVSKSFSVEDVTMEYVDHATRLENKKKLEKRYLDLLAKSKNVKEMLEIEEKLEEIRSDIEVKENQLKTLDKQIAYSEFSLTIEKRKINLTYDESNSYMRKIIQGVSSGWEGLKWFLITLITIWPIYIIIVLLYFVVRKLIRKWKSKKREINEKNS